MYTPNTTKLILGILFYFYSFTTFGQTLFDIYLKLPENSAMTNLSVRKQMISIHKTGKKNSNKEIYFHLDKVDHKNGYMTIYGAMEGYWSMCYWNLKNKEKLVAVLIVGCGPLCNVEQLDFYKYNGSSLTPIKQPLIESVTDSDFFDLNSKELESIYNKYDTPMSLLFSLPQKGKNIIARIYCELDGEGSDFDKILKPHQKGDRILLEFQPDGTFKKGVPFWNEKK